MEQANDMCQHGPKGRKAVSAEWNAQDFPEKVSEKFLHPLVGLRALSGIAVFVLSLAPQGLGQFSFADRFSAEGSEQEEQEQSEHQREDLSPLLSR